MVELLAPVRDETSFTAAVNAGADAVYLGLGRLNMRINSPGIDRRELQRIVRTAHEQSVKVYIALNVIVYDSELDEIDKLLDDIVLARADAVICWDPAVITKARQRQIPIHISTQANISNIESVRFYQQMGAKRVVLARELTLEQIRHIKQNTDVEIEAFIHGAMCVSVSGRCFMSQFLYNRSANRGDCLQPCRREYRIVDTETNDELDVGENYIISPKDLCALPILDQLIAAGIDSFKIEGRSRPPEYIQAVTRAYRIAIDACNCNKFNETLVNELLADLNKVYHRGFSKGFLMGTPGPADWSDRYGSRSHRKKDYVGKVLNFYKEKNIVHAHLSLPLSTGDVIQIHGPTTGIVEMTVSELRTDELGTVDTVEKGEITFPTPDDSILVRRNDKIYKIIEANDGTLDE